MTCEYLHLVNGSMITALFLDNLWNTSFRTILSLSKMNETQNNHRKICSNYLN